MIPIPPAVIKAVGVFAVLVVAFGGGHLAMAATLAWDRGSEQDLKEYTIWACYEKDCQVAKTTTTVQQPAVGVTPSATVEIDGKQGALAVTGTDLTGNESALGQPLLFNRRPDPCEPDSKALRDQVNP